MSISGVDMRVRVIQKLKLVVYYMLKYHLLNVLNSQPTHNL